MANTIPAVEKAVAVLDILGARENGATQAELVELLRITPSTCYRILQTLLEGERNVGDLADVLEMSQSAVSHQLRVLRQNDLVKYRKEGKTVFYSLDDEHIRMVLEQGMTHLRHKRGYHE